MIAGVSSLDEAGAGDLAYVDGDRFVDGRPRLARRRLPRRPGESADSTAPRSSSREPRFAFVRVVERFFTAPRRPRGVAGHVVRGAEVEIGPDASIWPFVTLGDRVTLGARVTLYPGRLRR